MRNRKPLLQVEMDGGRIKIPMDLSDDNRNYAPSVERIDQYGHEPDHCILVMLRTGEQKIFQLLADGLADRVLEEACNIWGEMAVEHLKQSDPPTFLPVPHPLAVYTRLTAVHDPTHGPGFPDPARATVLAQGATPVEDRASGRLLLPLWFDLRAKEGPQLEEAKSILRIWRDKELTPELARAAGGEDLPPYKGGTRKQTSDRVRRFTMWCAGQGQTTIALDENKTDEYGRQKINASIKGVKDNLGDIRYLLPILSTQPYPLGMTPA